MRRPSAKKEKTRTSTHTTEPNEAPGPMGLFTYMALACTSSTSRQGDEPVVNWKFCLFD
jgi:hypothetical protein